MAGRSARRWTFGAAALCLSVIAPAAQAQDFFSQLFGGFGRGRLIRLPFDDGYAHPPPQLERPRYGGGQAYCVRTCDGRYFPIAASDNASRAETCSSFCPATETRLVYGSNIDNATTENGKAYSDLPNAFRYRTEIVASCTCNGKDPAGLASIKVEDDPTLRKGDIVAGKDGLLVAGRRDKRGAEPNFSPAPDRIRAKYRRVPVVAAD
jgi:hypothetical protein